MVLAWIIHEESELKERKKKIENRKWKEKERHEVIG